MLRLRPGQALSPEVIITSYLRTDKSASVLSLIHQTILNLNDVFRFLFLHMYEYVAVFTIAAIASILD